LCDGNTVIPYINKVKERKKQQQETNIEKLTWDVVWPHFASDTTHLHTLPAWWQPWELWLWVMVVEEGGRNSGSTIVESGGW
jgi:hypothetical protein